MKNKIISLVLLTFIWSCQIKNNLLLYPNKARYTAKTNSFNYKEFNNENSDYSSKFSVYFAYNSSSLSNDSKNQLNSFIDNLSDEEKELVYYVEGNTDDSGTDNYNMILSRYRAENVKEYLISKGLTEQNLIILPKGENNPIANNTTEPNLNRRVTIYIKN